jgi:uncharacterized membrane-anchored protein YjiN (DUF445 family)
MALNRIVVDEARLHFGAERLRRMRWLATSLLALMLALLAISAACELRYPWLRWMRAFAEAGTVGAMADWYAVTALFRRPLGLPIPHTAIIPRHKDRIGATLGEFVEQNFLTPDNILSKLRQVDTAQALAGWLASRENSHAVASAVGDLIPAVLDGLEDDEVRQFLDRAFTPHLLGLNVSRIAGNLLMLLTRDDRHQAFLDRALRALEGWLVAKEGLIEAKFGEESPFTPRIVDRYVVGRFIQGIIALLQEVIENPQHELRGQFDQAAARLIQDLISSDEYRRKGQELLRDFIEHLRGEDFYRTLWEDVRHRLKSDLRGDSSLIEATVASALAGLGYHLSNEPGVRAKLNAWSLQAVRQIVVRFRHQISALISDVVKSWDADEISRKVEMEIGKDLQYIRINGTLVGGAVGLLLHAALRVAAT